MSSYGNGHNTSNGFAKTNLYMIIMHTINVCFCLKIHWSLKMYIMSLNITFVNIIIEILNRRNPGELVTENIIKTLIFCGIQLSF